MVCRARARGEAAADFPEAGSKRESPAIVASAISAAHDEERKEQGEQNMADELGAKRVGPRSGGTDVGTCRVGPGMGAVAIIHEVDLLDGNWVHADRRCMRRCLL